MREFMFAYGMNTHTTNVLLRCRNAKVIGETILPNHRLDFRYHLDVTPEANSHVEGVLWEVDSDDLEAIDQVEGYPDYYMRYMMAPYRKYLGSTYSAWTYMMRNKPELDYPNEHYLNLVLDGYQQNKISTRQIFEALERVQKYQWKKQQYHGKELT